MTTAQVLTQVLTELELMVRDRAEKNASAGKQDRAQEDIFIADMIRVLNKKVKA
jgi:hypothetical protein